MSAQVKQFEDLTLWSRRETGRRLCRHPNTIKDWEIEGTGPAYIKLPKGQVGYLPEDVEHWIRKNRIENEEETQD